MEFMLGGMAAVGACLFTNPLEVVKTRMQLQGELQARGLYTVHYRNVVHAFFAVARADGLLALQKGLVPGLWYQLCMNGVRLGAYHFAEIRGWTHDESGQTTLPRSIFVGAVTGAMGAISGSPLYLVKTHLQSQAATQVAVGHQHNHRGTAAALYAIYTKHGITGLWRGASGSIPRIAVGSAAQLSTFATCRERLDKTQIISENAQLNIVVASMVSSVAVALLMTPFDVVSTRLYNQGVDANGRGLLYQGVPDCFLKIWQTEGFLGFYKGLGASYFRLGPHIMLRGAAAMGACVFTNPMDVVKTRMQLQGELHARGQYSVHYRNVIHAVFAISKADGLLALQKGLAPSLCHQFLMNGIRLGAYRFAEIQGWTVNRTGNTTLTRSLVFGAGAGLLGAVAGSPMYLVKIHLQSQATSKVAVGYQHNHGGMFLALKSIYSQHGLRGLWRGVISSLPRTAVGSAAQLSTFSLWLEYLKESKIISDNAQVNTIIASMASRGVAAMGAGLFTNPLDVIKTRMQLQGELQARGKYVVHYRNVFHAFFAVAKADGLVALQKGLVPALWHQLFMNGTRLGSYHFAEDQGWTKNKNGQTTFLMSTLCGAASGVLGAFSGSPFFLVKTHLQSQSAAEVAVGHQHHHVGMISGLKSIYSQHGIPGLWRGSVSFVPRMIISSAVQLSTFTLCREKLQQSKIITSNEKINTILASIISSFSVVMIITPFDVVATRLYNQGVNEQGKGLLYRGVLDCFVKISRAEGFLGFYKGLGANAFRLGPHHSMEFMLGGISAVIANVFTNPLDVVKIRMQLQGELKARGQYTVHYRNVFHASYAIARTEGLLALQKGLIPSIWQQFVLNAVRFGAYQIAEHEGWTRDKNGKTTVIKSVVIGAVTGSAGAIAGSPMYLVKTQLQSQAASEIAVGHQHQHKGMLQALWAIYSQRGIRGLWQGATSAIPRMAVATAAQMSSFTMCREYLNSSKKISESPFTNTVVSSLISSIVVVILKTPFDVVSTRVYNQGVGANGRGLLYKGVPDCFVKMWKTEGLLGFYKGLGASYFRLGPHVVLSLIIWEELKLWHKKWQKD
ncbi:hypothetical protein B566_EDAN003660 [Ephemera danica]|nr:hypothetical protein B566_EDAN003660 [Ephemera danica]